MKVLVIDDDETIGFLLKLWLSSVELKEFNIQADTFLTCDDAFEHAQKFGADIVLMDVNLEGTSGVEGTKRFKDAFDNILICAMSADSHEESQEKMLEVGAYDYLIKPLIDEIFIKRITMYCRMLELRALPKENRALQTLFNAKVFTYTINFPLACDDDLLEFWDILTTRWNYAQEVSALHKTITAIYNFVDYHLKEGIYFDVKIQESESHFYMTLSANKKLAQRVLRNFLNHFDDNDVLTRASVIAIRSLKTTQGIEVPAQEPFVQRLLNQYTHQTQEATAPEVVYESQNYQVFSLFDKEELDDLETEFYKLNMSMKALQEACNPLEIEKVCLALESIGIIFDRYLPLHTMYYCITELEKLLQHDFSHLENWHDIYKLVNGYVEDIVTWFRLVFFEGATSINYLDDSLSANILVIKSLLEPETEDESVDDIFDF